MTWGKHFRPLTNITVQFGTCLIEICLNMIYFLFKFYSTLSKINIDLVIAVDLFIWNSSKLQRVLQVAKVYKWQWISWKKLFEDFCNLSLLFATSSLLLKVGMQQWCLLCFKRKKGKNQQNKKTQPSLITERPFVWSGLQNALSDSVLCSKLAASNLHLCRHEQFASLKAELILSLGR